MVGLDNSDDDYVHPWKEKLRMTENGQKAQNRETGTDFCDALPFVYPAIAKYSWPYCSIYWYEISIFNMSTLLTNIYMFIFENTNRDHENINFDNHAATALWYFSYFALVLGIFRTLFSRTP